MWQGTCACNAELSGWEGVPCTKCIVSVLWICFNFLILCCLWFCSCLVVVHLFLFLCSSWRWCGSSACIYRFSKTHWMHSSCLKSGSVFSLFAMYSQCIQPRIGRTNRYCYLPVRAKGYGAEMNRRKWNFITFHWNFSIFVYRCTGIIGSITDSINMGRKYTEFSVYTKKTVFLQYI